MTESTPLRARVLNGIENVALATGSDQVSETDGPNVDHRCSGRDKLVLAQYVPDPSLEGATTTAVYFYRYPDRIPRPHRQLRTTGL